MYLLNSETLKLKEFSSDGDIPEYAILSHTWGPPSEEVTFQDIHELDKARQKRGFEKISNCCRQAARDGYEWAWIDSCCINKSSSVELSEAINSMFNWYRRSTICYAFLDDVVCRGAHSWEWDEAIPRSFELSRWFTRGWTLQELIAPRGVEFYNASWDEIGTKASLAPAISLITGVPVDVLEDTDLTKCPAAEVMSWASGRQTTRIEDRAYSLLGLFNISMPLLYGEGTSAFRRLQEEILKATGDYTLFAWEQFWNVDRHFHASSPDDFSRWLPNRKDTSRRISQVHHKLQPDLSVQGTIVTPLSIWSNALRIQIHVGLQQTDGTFPAYLQCQWKQNLVCANIRPIRDDGRGLWTRVNSPLSLLPASSFSEFQLQDISFELEQKSNKFILPKTRFTSFTLGVMPPCMGFRAPNITNPGWSEQITPSGKTRLIFSESEDYVSQHSFIISHKSHSYASDGVTVRRSPRKTVPDHTIEVTFGLQKTGPWCTLSLPQVKGQPILIAESQARDKYVKTPSDRSFLIVNDDTAASSNFIWVGIKPMQNHNFQILFSCTQGRTDWDTEFLRFDRIYRHSTPMLPP